MKDPKPASISHLSLNRSNVQDLLSKNAIKIGSWKQFESGRGTRKIVIEGRDFYQYRAMCKFCKGHDNGYMVTKQVWSQVMTTYSGVVCLSCFQERLGRNLELEDFTEFPINTQIRLILKSQEKFKGSSND